MEALQKIPTPSAAQPTTENAGGELHDCAILIVDDSRLARSLIRAAFERAGYRNIRAASDGVQALSEIASFCPDLVILDLHMPEMDGFEVCRHLRGAALTARLPILVHSSIEKPTDVEAVFAAGASDLLRKPVQLPELLARTRAHLERWRVEQHLVAYRSRVARELAAARRLHAGIVPSEDDLQAVARSTGLLLRGGVEPSAEIGGDIWGVTRIDENRVTVFTADLAGHGIVSAINAFRVHTLLTTGSFDPLDPAAALTDINRILCRTLERGEFATFIVGLLDLSTHEFVYATAGAPPPIIGHFEKSEARLCDARGLPVGIHAGASYENRRTQLLPGEFLLLYSDALTDVPDSFGRPTGWDGLCQIVGDVPRLADPMATLDRLWTRLRSALPSPPPDDLTIAIIGRPPEKETVS